MWNQFMDELRTIHLGEPTPDQDGSSIHEQLNEAFERAQAQANSA